MNPNWKTVEKLFQDVMNEDLVSIKQSLTSDKDLAKWSTLLKQEMAIVTLMEGILESDIMLPRLVVCGVRTMSPLHYSALRGADSILANFLAHARIPVQTQLSGGSTLLHFACFAGNLTTIKMLIDEWSADMHTKDSYGWSPLHYASIGGQYLAAEELCIRGANVMDRDQDGTTPAYRAHIFGHDGLVDYYKKLTNNNTKLLTVEQENINSVTASGKVNVKNDNTGKKTSGELKDIDFIIDNAYDFPDENMVTRIQCKYVSNSETNNNKTTTANTPTTNSNDKKIKVGGSVYDLPDDLNDKISATEKPENCKKEMSKKKIQAIVESQFKDVFGENNDDYYLQPTNQNNSGAGLYDTINSNKELPYIGFRTLKYLLRSEFQKYKSTLIPPSLSTTQEQQQNSNNNNAAIYDDIYEEIAKVSVRKKENNWVKGGQTIRSRFNEGRPPLPPRNSKISEDLFKPQPALPQQQQQRDSFAKEFNLASNKLNLIEETQIVREACFTELLSVLGVGDWQKLALALPIRENKFMAEEKIKMIEKQFPKDPRKQARAALQDWNFHFGKNATLDKLVVAMKKCGLVEKIKSVEMACNREFVA